VGTVTTAPRLGRRAGQESPLRGRRARLAGRHWRWGGRASASASHKLGQSVGRVRHLNSSSGAAPRAPSSRAMVVSLTSLPPRSIREISLILIPAASPS
jgi:hypothetical protein